MDPNYRSLQLDAHIGMWCARRRGIAYEDAAKIAAAEVDGYFTEYEKVLKEETAKLTGPILEQIRKAEEALREAKREAKERAECAAQVAAVAAFKEVENELFPD